MKRKRPLPDPEERRSVLRGLATGLAGVVTVPGAVSAGTSETPVQAGGSPSSAGPSTSEGLLDSEERGVLESLSELLVPGSVAAGVPELVDRVAAVESTENQRQLRDALRAFEGRARLRFGSRWIALEPDAQLAILKQAASGSEAGLGDAFLHLRDRVAQSYFATEPGMRKLGWTRRSAWPELPACNHPDDDHR